MKLRQHIILTLLSTAAVSATAQGLNTEITVEREVVPLQLSATRLPLVPALSLPAVAPVSLSVSDRYEATTVPPYLAQLEPGRLRHHPAAQPLPWLYRRRLLPRLQPRSVGRIPRHPLSGHRHRHIRPVQRPQLQGAPCRRRHRRRPRIASPQHIHHRLAHDPPSRQPVTHHGPCRLHRVGLERTLPDPERAAGRRRSRRRVDA